jgi:hypothetical protein
VGLEPICHLRVGGFAVRVKRFFIDAHRPARAASVFALRADTGKTLGVEGQKRLDAACGVQSGHVVLWWVGSKVSKPLRQGSKTTAPITQNSRQSFFRQTPQKTAKKKSSPKAALLLCAAQ